MDALLSVLVIATGGALGAVTRFWLSGVVGRRIGETFPWGTLVVNTTGAAAIGFLAAALPILGPDSPTSIIWLGAAPGFLGGYTTVSSFSLQTMTLMRVNEWGSAAANIVASVVLCLSGATVGFAVGSLAV